MVIRILSFGPLLKVTGPDSFAALIRERIERMGGYTLDRLGEIIDVF